MYGSTSGRLRDLDNVTARGEPMMRDESSPRARDHAARGNSERRNAGSRVWLIHALEREHRNNDVDRVATDPIFHP